MLTKKNVSAIEHTPIPVVLGSSIAIGRSLCMVVLQRSSGTRSRPVKKDSLYHCIFRVGSSVMRLQHCHKMGLLDIFNHQFNSKCIYSLLFRFTRLCYKNCNQSFTLIAKKWVARVPRHLKTLNQIDVLLFCGPYTEVKIRYINKQLHHCNVYSLPNQLFQLRALRNI